MEPPLSPLQRGVEPKLHLLMGPPTTTTPTSTSSASDRSLFPKLKLDAARTAVPCSPSTTRHHDSFSARVPTSRVYLSAASYLDSPCPPPFAKPHPHPPPQHSARSSRGKSNNEPSRHSSPSPADPTPRDEFLVLHPSLDLNDENGELSQLLLSKWSINTDEHRFTSISLFCEMKLSEARRMTSWVERPNRFFATVCCELLHKYVERLESQQLTPESGASASFLRKIHDELAQAIFHNATATNYMHCVPYFLEYKKIRRHAQLLMASVETRERAMAAKEKLPLKIDKLLRAQQAKSNSRLLAMLFRAWRSTAQHGNQVRQLKCNAFRSTRKLNVSALFRAWRIEALRRAYQRESVEYQTMLSITAASLSRKDVQIAENDSKMASMAKIIDSLTESNAQLLYRNEQLEAVVSGDGNANGGFGGRASRGGGSGGGGGGGGGLLGLFRSQDGSYDHIDSLTSGSSEKDHAIEGGGGGGDDEKSDRTNRMLLETMLGMARMVESCAIQLSKDMMDSLEHQLDGSLLQQLAEMIHLDNVAKIKAEEARGILYGASPPSTPSSSGSSSGVSRSQLARVMAATTSGLHNNTMLASMGKGVVAIKDLALMPTDAFLLSWFKMNLEMSSAAEKTSDRTIKNFTSDLADGRRFSFLLHRLFPTWFDANMVHEIDVDERLKNVAGFHARFQPVLPQVVTSDSIHSGSATENVAFTAMLFGISTLSIRRINLDRQREKFLSIITSWKRVRSLLLEVKRMNKSYDSLMVVHLLKEMRTCETLFKQLNSELCSIAIASNESASTLSQIAYKVLQLTWRCVHAKQVASASSSGSGSSTTILELVDERLAERIKDFTHVEISTVRQLLVNDSTTASRGGRGGGGAGGKASATATVASLEIQSLPVAAIPERDVATRTEAMRDVLGMYCKDLHDIFKHYSASGGAGSIASMSLSEFLKFLKDCALVSVDGQPAGPATTGSSNKHAHSATTAGQAVLTPPMVEFIYNAALFFSPQTPREFAVAALQTDTTGDAPSSSSVSSSSPGAALPQPAASLSTTNAPPLVFPSADPLRPEPLILTLAFGDREMVGFEFVDALLRVAAIKCPASSHLLLEERFRDFMELHVLPNALRSQSEIFRAEVASPKVRAVFQKHKTPLQRVFRYYTSMHALREQQSTMDLKEFTIFVKDCKLIGSFVTEHTLKQVLINLQHDDDVGSHGAPLVRAAPPSGAGGGGATDDASVLRVDFADFQEAIAALTEYVICNPYVPLYKRIEQFVNENVLPRARQKNERSRQ